MAEPVFLKRRGGHRGDGEEWKEEEYPPTLPALENNQRLL